MVQFRNSNSKMETETIQKNGASLKSHTSRGNFLRKVCFALLIAGIGLCFARCEKKDVIDVDVIDVIDITYHCEGSADLIAAYDFAVMYYTEKGQRIQETVQLPWQKTIKGISLPVSNVLEWIGTPKQNYLRKDNYNIDVDAYVTFSRLGGQQPPRLPVHYAFYGTVQPITGKYQYTLKIEKK